MAAIRKKKKRNSVIKKQSEYQETVPIGLDNVLARLNEMLVWPLLYPSFFKRMNIKPSRGVLFYGPPGTGKTMMARYIVGYCNKIFEKRKEKRKLTLFIKNGAECLSKWIGEAEKSLSDLFEKARKSEPSIIFFDEIDGLAPKRTEKTEQSHISVVSCLLSLMDGLKESGRVFVIGTTNRLDSLDNALRRPGRFDKELRFEIPSHETRKEMFLKNTSTWPERIPPFLLNRLIVSTTGFSGADLKSLCDEAVIVALKRELGKGNLMKESISVFEEDFKKALLQGSFCRGFGSMPFLFEKKNTEEIEEYASSILSLFYQDHFVIKAYQPRFLFCSESGCESDLKSIVYQTVSKILETKNNFHIQWLSFGLNEKELLFFIQTLSYKRPSFVIIEDIEGFCEKEPETIKTLSSFFKKEQIDSGVGVIATSRSTVLSKEAKILMKMKERLELCKVFFVKEEKKIDKKTLYDRVFHLYEKSGGPAHFEAFFEEEGDKTFVEKISLQIEKGLSNLNKEEISVFLSRILPKLFLPGRKKEEIEENLSLLLKNFSLSKTTIF